jgi:uncharacterized membrane protein YkoI
VNGVKKKVSFLLRMGLFLAFAIMVFSILSSETVQAQETDTEDNGMSIEEMRNAIIELRALVQELIRNQNNSPQATPSPPADGAHTTARLDEAGAAAIRANGGRGLIRHICLDWERGVAVYHVRLYDSGNRVDIHLNRSDLSVERNRSRQHNNASSSSSSFQRRQMNTTPTLSFNQAADAALAYFGGGTIREVSRSYIGGRGNVTAVFDVDIVAANGERWCVYVDLHTGAILDYHRD